VNTNHSPCRTNDCNIGIRMGSAGKYKKDSGRMEESERLLELLANKRRLAILSLLKEKGEKSVGQIADHLELEFKIISKHLILLAEKGILSRRYDGPFVLYQISANLPPLFRTIINELL
jgi:ArsR family transcriptional regulator, arsenate/arsenite/antimonite-responsive transcriptional repressor